MIQADTQGQSAQAAEQTAPQSPAAIDLAKFGFPAETPEEPAAAPYPEPKPEPEKPTVEQTRIADQIRRDRETRAARAREQQEHQTLQQKLAAAEAKVKELAASANFEDDPIGYIRSRKVDRERQAHIGQMLLYDLVPEKADANTRLELFKADLSFKERKAEEARQAQEAQRAEEARAQAEAQGLEQVQQYHAILTHAVQTVITPELAPESVDYFGEDQSAYAQSLLATANNMADAAREAGRAVDLSPANVARVLEAEIAGRMARRDARRGTRTPAPVEQKQTAPAGGMQPAANTTSTQGLNNAGRPRPPAQTEDERIARAMEVVFRGSR